MNLIWFTVRSGRVWHNTEDVSIAVIIEIDPEWVLEIDISHLELVDLVLAELAGNWDPGKSWLADDSFVVAILILVESFLVWKEDNVLIRQPCINLDICVASWSRRIVTLYEVDLEATTSVCVVIALDFDAIICAL